jgi:hypothetical protein
MRFDRHIPVGRARFYRWVGTSGFVGVTWSLVLAFVAAVGFDYMPAMPGWPVVHGIVECPTSGFVVQGAVEHWVLSSTARLEAVVPAHRCWFELPEDRAAWMAYPPPGAPIGSSITTRAFGWPFRCLVREGPLAPPPPIGMTTLTAGGITIPNRVYLPGLLADTGSFAVPVFAMGWCAGAMRRRRRRGRGACEGCGYSLVGNVGGVCPECGREGGGADAAR